MQPVVRRLFRPCTSVWRTVGIIDSRRYTSIVVLVFSDSLKLSNTQLHLQLETLIMQLVFKTLTLIILLAARCSPTAVDPICRRLLVGQCLQRQNCFPPHCDLLDIMATHFKPLLLAGHLAASSPLLSNASTHHFFLSVANAPNPWPPAVPSSV